jgi:hypothetical protein
VVKAGYMAALCLGVCASGAFAADVSIRGNVGETLEGSDNYFLQNSPLGSTFKSLTAVNLDVLARTPGWRYLLASHVSYYNYFGDGADATTPKSGTPINETFRVDHANDDSRYFFFANYTRADIAATQLRETGFTTNNGVIDSFRASAGGSHDINRTDSVSWSILANRTTFEDAPLQTPFTDIAASAAWTRLLDPRTTWTTSVNFDWLDADDIGKSQRLFWQILTGVKSQLTRRLTVTASVGAGFANAYQTAAVPPGTTSNFIRTGAASSVLALGTLNYQLLSHTFVTLSAAHLIVPTSFGQLQKTTTAGFTLAHDINYWSRIAFSTNFAHTDQNANFNTTGAADFFSAQLVYSYRLARDWRSAVSYTYRQRHDDTGTATSNTFLLSMFYDFNLLGNPNAFDPVEQERALIRQQKAVTEVFPTLQ